MPRVARKKSIESSYHVMVRSVGGINLFEDDEDKNKYLSLIMKYQYQYWFKIYAYCLMDNHGHMLIDANGADISRFMKSINQSYAQYYNRKYQRRGHVFADRFKSKIVEDDKYLLSLSAYIHRNPKDMKKWRNNIGNYPYSSLGIYLGLRNDEFNMLEEGFIMQLFDICLNQSREKYLDFINQSKDITIKQEVEFEDEGSQYRSERVIIKRNFKPKDVVRFVSGYIGIDEEKLLMKYRRASTEGKALSMVLMRRYCDFTVKDICGELTNITQSRVSKLCEKGLDLVIKDKRYTGLFEEFLHAEIA